MDSGLGSDDEKRNRTKAQKQLQNEQKQLFSSCFIDATSLGDESECDSRRTDERRQGALIFRSSIPQYSMLQMPHLMVDGEASDTPDHQGDAADTATPHNSIVQVDEVEMGKKTPIGFFVDLGDVPEAEPAPPVEKKTIFSMIIDYNVPKREMPSRLSTSLYGRRKNEIQKSGATSSKHSSASSNCDGDAKRSDSGCCVNSLQPEDKAKDEFVRPPSDADAMTDNQVNCEQNEHSTDNQSQNDCKVEESSRVTQQYVRLSDLEEQSPRLDLFLAPRMSRSIPEKSWVESPLATFRSASYRSSPQPYQPDPNEPSDAEAVAPPKRSAQRLGTDLLRMFLEEIGPDVTLEVNGRKLRAHRCILSSRCQYFAAVLGGGNTSDVSIQGYSYAAVHFALCHIYSGAAHIPHSISLVELAALSDMLGLEGLKEVVAHAFQMRHCHNFHEPCSGCIAGAAEVLPLSAAYGLDELYQAILHWITRHFIEVWPSRTFVNLPRELRDKCYQQHVVHMAPESVLDTTLSSDKLLAAMPTAKWAEPVAQLTLQLADHCQMYLRQNYAAVLACSSFAALDGREPEVIGQLEENLVTTAGSLKLDQACRSYINCHKMLQQKSWSATFLAVLRRIYGQIESCVVRQAGQASRSNVWMQLEPALRKRIRDLSAKFSSNAHTPTRTKPDTINRPLSSSSDSSRNSSPAINKNQVHSPSLRRSLLIAARTSQMPSSPSTCRRISTLTNPTQSSAAKSTVKSSQRTTASNKSAPPAAAPSKIAVPQKVLPPKRETPAVRQKENLQRKRVSNVTKAGSGTSRTVKTSASATTKKPSAAPKQVPVSSDCDDRRSPGMQRSSTFLKEEPTVLGKM